MVSARTLVILSLVLTLFSVEGVWLTIIYSRSGDYYNFSVVDLAGPVGLYFDGAHLTQNNTLNGQMWSVFAPVLTSGTIVAAEWAFPVSLVFGALSLFRWKLMMVSGAASVSSGVLWILGIDGANGTLENATSHLPSFAGQGGAGSVGYGLGPYIAIIGGSVMLLGFALSVVKKLDVPI